MKTIPRLALACSVALVIGSGTPTTGASEASRPGPLRRDARLVVQDIAARFGVVGVGWREDDDQAGCWWPSARMAAPRS